MPYTEIIYSPKPNISPHSGLIVKHKQECSLQVIFPKMYVMEIVQVQGVIFQESTSNVNFQMETIMPVVVMSLFSNLGSQWILVAHKTRCHFPL